jgi:hypothetical protein
VRLRECAAAIIDAPEFTTLIAIVPLEANDTPMACIALTERYRAPFAVFNGSTQDATARRIAAETLGVSAFSGFMPV